jgi:hypothetical protein
MTEALFKEEYFITLGTLGGITTGLYLFTIRFQDVSRHKQYLITWNFPGDVMTGAQIYVSPEMSMGAVMVGTKESLESTKQFPGSCTSQ